MPRAPPRKRQIGVRVSHIDHVVAFVSLPRRSNVLSFNLDPVAVVLTPSHSQRFLPFCSSNSSVFGLKDRVVCSSNMFHTRGSLEGSWAFFPREPSCKWICREMALKCHLKSILSRTSPSSTPLLVSHRQTLVLTIGRSTCLASTVPRGTCQADIYHCML